MDHLINGIGLAVEGRTLLLIVLGTLWGIVGGALPGISTTVAVSLLIPVSYYLQPTEAVALLAATYAGTGFGNGISATLIRTPGTPSAVLNVIEGYPLHERGEGGRALVVNLFAASTGQLLGGIGFILFMVPLAAVATNFLKPEIFALSVLAMVAVASVTGKDPLKGYAALLIGLGIATVGADPVTGQPRFVFDIPELWEGFDIVPVIIGLLALGEAFYEIEKGSRLLVHGKQALGSLWISLRELASYAKMIVIGTIVGFVVGVIPGIGGTTAAFVSYQQAKLYAKRPNLFGRGSYEAIAAMNAADNAVFGGEFVPTLGLGIPGSASQAVVLSALVIHGVQPGPQLLRTRPELVETVLGAMVVASVLLIPLGLALIKPSVWLSLAWPPAVAAGTIALTLVGTFSIRGWMFDVYAVVGFGVLGYVLRKLGFPLAPVAVAFVLGSTLEETLRQGLLMSYNDPLLFLSRPVTLVLLLAALAFAGYQLRASRRLAEDEADK